MDLNLCPLTPQTLLSLRTPTRAIAESISLHAAGLQPLSSSQTPFPIWQLLTYVSLFESASSLHQHLVSKSHKSAMSEASAWCVPCPACVRESELVAPGQTFQCPLCLGSGYITLLRQISSALSSVGDQIVKTTKEKKRTMYL